MFKPLIETRNTRSMVILSRLVVILISCKFASYLGTPTPAARHQWIKKWLNDCGGLIKLDRKMG